MQRYRLEDLKAGPSDHLFKEVLSGQFIYRGGMSFEKPGGRSHTNDGPDGRDYHVHEDQEAFIILQGEGSLELNKALHPLAIGDVLVIEPGEDHHLVSSQENPLVVLWCHAGPEPHKSPKAG